jgi:hypothetical protein
MIPNKAVVVAPAIATTLKIGQFTLHRKEKIVTIRGFLRSAVLQWRVRCLPLPKGAMVYEQRK